VVGGRTGSDSSRGPGHARRLFNRAADNWRPLLAIADAAGGEWPARARRAPQCAGATGGNPSACACLPTRAIFAERRVGRLPLPSWLRPWSRLRGALGLNGEKPGSRSRRTASPASWRRSGSCPTRSARAIGRRKAASLPASRMRLSVIYPTRCKERNTATSAMALRIFLDPQPHRPVLRFERPRKSSRDGHCCGVAVETGPMTPPSGKGASPAGCFLMSLSEYTLTSNEHATYGVVSMS